MKTFISIGTGPGMGFATAERFAKEGYAVVLAARSADKVRDLAAQLVAKGYKTEAATVDTSNGASVEALISDVKRRHGSVDVIHYNAASMRQAKIGDQPTDTLVSDLATNIGEDVVFLVEGKSIKHHAEDRGDDRAVTSRQTVPE